MQRGDAMLGRGKVHIGWCVQGQGRWKENVGLEGVGMLIAVSMILDGVVVLCDWSVIVCKVLSRQHWFSRMARAHTVSRKPSTAKMVANIEIEDMAMEMTEMQGSYSGIDVQISLRSDERLGYREKSRPRRFMFGRVSQASAPIH
jgi:hypothetical protein